VNMNTVSIGALRSESLASGVVKRQAREYTDILDEVTRIRQAIKTGTITSRLRRAEAMIDRLYAGHMIGKRAEGSGRKRRVAWVIVHREPIGALLVQITMLGSRNQGVTFDADECPVAMDEHALVRMTQGGCHPTDEIDFEHMPYRGMPDGRVYLRTRTGLGICRSEGTVLVMKTWLRGDTLNEHKGRIYRELGERMNHSI
jgi:hypothetical protein